MTHPHQIDAYLSQLRAALPAGSPQAERLVAEAEDHLLELVERLVATGMPQEAAVEEALARFGTPDRIVRFAYSHPGSSGSRRLRAGQPRWRQGPGNRRKSKDRGDGIVQSLLQDIRYGLRTLARNPGFTVVAVLTLALGIGANTAIFAIVNGVLLQPLPYDNPGRLVLLSSRNEQRGWSSMPIPPGTFFELGGNAQTFEALAGYAERKITLTGGEEPLRIEAARATANLFSLLGVDAERGRVFLPEEDVPGTPDVALLSTGLWRRYFGGDTDIIGKMITLDDKPYTVVGVMRQEFQFPSTQVEVWIPMKLDPGQPSWGNWFLTGIGRLKKGTPLTQSQAEIDTLTAAFSDNLPFGGGWNYQLKSLTEEVVGEVRPALLVLLGAVGLILLLACANVANLLLSRASGRAKELAVRTAVGASRQRLLGQLLAETLLLSLLSGLAAIFAVEWGLSLLVLRLPGDFPRLEEIGVDGTVLTFVVTASCLAGLLAGLFPALQASRVNLIEALKDAGRSSSGGGARSRAREILVVAEVALSILLLAGAGLLVRSFLRLLEVDTGFQPRNVLTMRISLPRSRYPGPQQQSEFLRQLSERAALLPAIHAVGATTGLPTRNVSMIDSSLTVEGAADTGDEPSEGIAIDAVLPDYFHSLGIRLLRGRFFMARDTASAPKVVIINDRIARQFFPNEDPVGRRILHSNDTDWMTIVGVVADVKQYGLEKESPKQMFLPFAQEPKRSFYLTVLSTGRPEERFADLKGLVRSLDSDLPATDIQTMEQAVATSMAHRRFYMLLMSFFGVLALVLAVVGIYGVISYSVSQRTHEIGVRMALGAGRGDILRMVIGRGMGLSVAGVVAGLLGAFYLTRFLQSLLFEVGPADPVTFVAIVILLLAVSALACYVPARRATKVDPMVALRYE